MRIDKVFWKRKWAGCVHEGVVLFSILLSTREWVFFCGFVVHEGVDLFCGFGVHEGVGI